MWYTLCLVAGIILLAISLSRLKDSLRFLRTSERTTATVIEIERISGSDGDTFKPIFKFRTHRNQEITWRRGYSSSPAGWSIGDETTIAYDPENPSRARLLTYFGIFSLPVILMMIAAPLLIIGGGYHVSQYFLK